VKPLRFGTLRYHLFKLTHGRALRAGKPIVLTREQLSAAFPRGHEQHSALPAEYTAEVYVLTGDDDLRPVT
jgi:hypothetical protein